MRRRTQRARALENPRDTGGAGHTESELCGYRLVRVLDSTPVSTTWLATRVDGPSVPDTPVVPVPNAVELTRFTGAPPNRVVPEAALAVSSPHVHGAIDLATDDAGRVVLLAERTERTLAALLSERATLRLGEAVTILAPTATGVAALHRSGFVHGALTAEAVSLTPDGRPVLSRLADASAALPPGSQGETLRRADLAALRALIGQVLGRCSDTDDEAVSALLRWVDRTIGTDDDGASFFAQLDLRLFALADPLPIGLRADATTTDAANVTVQTPTATDRAHRAPPPDAGGWLSRVLVGTGIDSLAELADSFTLTRRLTARTAGIGGWTRRALRGRAAVLVVATAVAIVAVWGGLALVPDSGRAADRPQAPPSTAAQVDLTEAERDALAADDPGVALSALLAVRSRCLASGGTDCVLLCDEPGSAAESTDLHAISTNGVASLAGQPGGAAEMLQRTGNAVLFRVSDSADTANQPVLVLVMKTGTGWRLRDLSDPDDVAN